MSSLFVLTLGFAPYECVCFCSSLFLEHVSNSCFVSNNAYLFINYLCLFLLGWHMFLLRGRSKSTCMVRVGGAA